MRAAGQRVERANQTTNGPFLQPIRRARRARRAKLASRCGLFAAKASSARGIRTRTRCKRSSAPRGCVAAWLRGSSSWCSGRRKRRATLEPPARPSHQGSLGLSCTFTGVACQMSLAYSRMVRSDENCPTLAMFLTAIVCQLVLSKKASDTLF